MMVLRLTRLVSKPGQMPALREVYNAQIIPEIRAMKGHHSSHIMEGETRPDEALGWIVWDEPEFADRYVNSGSFAKHIELLRPMLANEPFIDAFKFI